MLSRGSGADSAPAIGDRVEAARALHADGRTREALDLLTGPGDVSQDVYTLRGDLQLHLGQVHEAHGSFSTAIAMEQTNVYALYRLAICLCRLERWELAAETFRKLLAHDSYSDLAQIGLGDCLLHLKQPEEALSCFEACWSESARLPAMFGKAVALQMLRRFDEAEVLYGRILELDPASEEALGNLIAMCVEVFDLSRVERYALRLAGRSRQSPVALQALTLVAFELRDYKAAAGYLDDLMKTAPDGKFSRNGEGEEDMIYRLSVNDMRRLSPFRRNSPTAPPVRLNGGMKED